MVQVVENWAELRGRVIAVAGHKQPRFATAKLAVDSVSDVDGFPNLFAEEKGHVVDVAIPATTASLRVGDAVVLRVRRTPRGNFAAD